MIRVSTMQFKTNYPDNNYTIYVGEDILSSRLEAYTSKYPSVFYLVDEMVYEIHRHELLSNIDAPITLPKGEAAKEFSIYIESTETLLSRGIKRNSLIVAIGGGALGDAAGFIAATVLRGVDYIHVPTTILAHDSAVGGKTAINSSQGKNLIGSFHRPKGVIMDTGFFKSLPYDEVLSGYGEVFKHALLNDAAQVNVLLDRFSDTLDVSNMDDVIAEGINTKLRYVTDDEFESGSRKYLNLGHTLGHAIERVHNVSHGHAVIIGLLFMMHVSNIKYSDAGFNLLAYIKHFRNIGIDLDVAGRTEFTALCPYLLKDKKNVRDDYISFVLMESVGKPADIELSLDEIEQYFKSFNETLNKDA